MGAWVSRAISFGDASLPKSSATDAFIAAFSWQPLSGGVMIGAEVGRMTSRVGESRAPKSGPLMASPEKARSFETTADNIDQTHMTQPTVVLISLPLGSVSPQSR